VRPARRIRARDSLRQAALRRFRRTHLSTTPGDAAMLRILIEAGGARRGIEIGVERGFGSMHMGMGFERTGGRLYSIEIDPARALAARRNIEKVGLEKTVSIIEGAALDVLPRLKGRFDFVFLDAEKSDYLKYLKAIEARLKPGAVVVADNVIVRARPMADFLDYVQNSPDYDTVIIRASMEKNDGMSVSCKIR
jgi:predicted O-methyltransferase YrrM